MAGPDVTNPDVANIEPPSGPTPGKEALSPQPDTKNLDTLLASLNKSAKRFQKLWGDPSAFSLLAITVYLAHTVHSTTHRDLLLGRELNFPFINIQVDSLSFFVRAPLFFFGVHSYVVMVLALLARSADAFESELRKTLVVEADRKLYRTRVDDAPFLQLLIGEREGRPNFDTLLVGSTALVTIVLAPLATLIFIQLKFLPYHSFGITWWHRGVVAADVILILVIWGLLAKSPLVPFRARPKLRLAARWLTGLALFAVAFWLSSWEGRWAGEPRPSFDHWRWWAGKPLPFSEGHPDFASTAEGVVFGRFPDRLQLANETIVGEQRFEQSKKEIASRGGEFVPTITLDGGDLKAAVLSGADLRGVALRGARMEDALLDGAHLEGAQLYPLQIGDDIVPTTLQNTDIEDAHLEQADLNNAQLQNANLRDAHLQGTDLSFAFLPRALLFGAELPGANLFNAHLQGAVLSRAQLQGANLHAAELQDADISEAQLQGADLTETRLEGADLSGAQLQGADLTLADLSDSKVDGTFVFRAEILGGADLLTTVIRSVHADKVKPAEFGDGTDPLSDADINKWIDAATEFGIGNYKKALSPDVQMINADKELMAIEKEEAVRRLNRLRSESNAGDEDASSKWAEQVKQSAATVPGSAEYRQRLANRLLELACEDPNGAPYVARGLVASDRLSALGDQLERVRQRMGAARDKPKLCRGVAGFTKEDWLRLDAIKPN